MLKTNLFIVFLYIGGFTLGQCYPDLKYYETGYINQLYFHEAEDSPMFKAALTNEDNGCFIKICGDFDQSNER
jgi:hypothetical protein